MTEFKPNEERAKHAKNILIVNLIITGVYFLQSLYTFFPLLIAGNTDIWVLFDALENEPSIPLLDKLNFIASISAVVYVIKWFRRAYFNLHIRIPNLKYDESAAVWSWFVPILNFFAPYQIMVDLVSRSQVFLIEKGIRPKVLIDGKLPGWWWLSYISGAVFVVFWLLSIYTGALNSGILFYLFIFGNNLLTILSGFILIKIISHYTIIETQLVDLRSEIDEIGVEVE
jgi:hypothetical protein